MKIQNKQQAKNIARAINDFYMGENPPPTRVIVPQSSLGTIKEEKDVFYKASVRVEVNWVNKTVKSHKVNIRFALTPNGKLDGRTLQYL